MAFDKDTKNAKIYIVANRISEVNTFSYSGKLLTEDALCETE